MNKKKSLKVKIRDLLYKNESTGDYVFYIYNIIKTNIKKKNPDFNYLSLLNEKIKENQEKKIAFVIGTPEHNNIGDAAIAYAELEFIKQEFPQYNVIEIPENKVLDSIKLLNKEVRKCDMVFYHGGGNMGSIYISQELARQSFVQQFSKVPIVSFPQSIVFEKNNITDKLEKRMIRCYNENPDFLLVSREKQSLNIMQNKFYNKNICYTPDIVLSLDIYEKLDDVQRNGVITLMRNDDEKRRSELFFQNIMLALKEEFLNNITISDTTLPSETDEIPYNRRSDILFSKWNEIRKHELVITDRLHGMIFSYITRTPCLIVMNRNHKIISTLTSWMKGCSYISVLDDDINFDNMKKKIHRMRETEIIYEDLKPYFDGFIELTKGKNNE